MNTPLVKGFNHLLGETLEVVKDNPILVKMRLEKGTLYKVTAKAGMAIRLSEPDGKITPWIADAQATMALRPWFDPSPVVFHRLQEVDRSELREEMWRWIWLNAMGTDLLQFVPTRKVA